MDCLAFVFLFSNNKDFGHDFYFITFNIKPYQTKKNINHKETCDTSIVLQKHEIFLDTRIYGSLCVNKNKTKKTIDK